MFFGPVHKLFRWLFEVLARGLLKIGCSANAITFMGFVFTAAAGVCLAFAAGARWGPNGWLFAGGFLMVGSGVCDFLDGKVARMGGGVTKFGAFWDSTLDRLSDTALMGGILWHFLLAGNLTFVALSLSALAASLIISYCRCRAEHVIERCQVGYWERPERLVGLNIAVFFHKVPAFMVLLGITCWQTVLARIWWTYRQTKAARTGKPAPTAGWAYHLQAALLWYHRRRGWPYLLLTATLILGYCLLPFYGEGWDPIRSWIGRGN
jgi:CDP-diacylglycerol--glycerol-3-phosphate 3-phosphatidyltransferase